MILLNINIIIISNKYNLWYQSLRIPYFIQTYLNISISSAHPTAISLFYSYPLIIVFNTEDSPLNDLPPAFSIKNDNGAHSYKYLNLQGFFISPKRENTPFSFKNI